MLILKTVELSTLLEQRNAELPCLERARGQNEAC